MENLAGMSSRPISRYRKGGIAFLTVCLVLLLGLAGAGLYMISYALQPDGLSRSRDLDGSFHYMYDTYPGLQEWVDSLQDAGALGDLYLTDEKGEPIHALYVAAAHPTRRTAVIVHGYTDNAIRMLHIGRLYSRELGFNILLPDLHGHGLSGGEEIQMGWLDRLDVLRWTEQADELFGHLNDTLWVDGTPRVCSTGTEMVVHGISMGAATTMMVAGEVEYGVHQQPFIKCFVEDCGYTSVWDEFQGELKAQFGLPAFPLLHVTDWLCRLKCGWGFRQASALHQVQKCHLPMLFIHGEADDFVPTWMVHPLYEAHAGEKELWLVPGVDHAHSYRDCPDEYTRRVKNFVGKYIH